MKDLRQKTETRPGLAANIKSGMAVPIISDEAILDLVLPGRASVTQAYAEYTGYPLQDRDNLPLAAKVFKLAQQRQALAQVEPGVGSKDFTSADLKADFLGFMKNFIYEHAEKCGAMPEALNEAAAQVEAVNVTGFAGLLGYPRLREANPNDPLQVLADLPFRALLTTSPYTFLERALGAAHKSPRTAVVRWRPDLRDLIGHPPPAERGKEIEQPLVCHLFGLEDYPNSLMLTEDDYLDFVVDVNLARGDDKHDSLPAEVREALSGDLLVLGFSLTGWSFRALYSGLIKSDDTRKQTRRICVQVKPSAVEQTDLHDYLQREARFEVEWKDVGEFTAGLRS